MMLVAGKKGPILITNTTPMECGSSEIPRRTMTMWPNPNGERGRGEESDGLLIRFLEPCIGWSTLFSKFDFAVEVIGTGLIKNSKLFYVN